MVGKIGRGCICAMGLAAWQYARATPAAHNEMSGAFSYECDDACLLPGAPVPAGKHAVVSPVGKQIVNMIEQAPRLDTLDGKTVAVVGGSFMANITHPEIKRLLLSNYPAAKVLLLNELGSAGPYPGPGVRRDSKDEFQRKLKEMGVQAVISGNGGCGLCTPKETGSSIAAEYLGIPAVTVAAPNFVNQVYSTAVTHGVPARYTMDMHVKKIIRDEGGELTDPPPWMAKVPGQEKISTIPVMKAGMTPILVTGDADRNKVQTMPGGNSATVQINLPANWDDLMAKLGYRPLHEFFLKP